MNDTPLTIIHHDPPEPADIDPRTGWSGAIMMVISGPVVGELWRYIDTDGSVTHDTEFNVEYQGDKGADLKIGDPQHLRHLAAVAAFLAVELDAARPSASFDAAE
jgi:hypothetical protein